MSEVNVTQWMVDQLVAPEHQYLDADDPPLDSLRIQFSSFEEAPF